MKILSQIAFRNALKNWRHSLAAIASISAGFLSLVVFQGYISDVNRMYEIGFNHRAMYGHLVIENPEINTPEGKARSEELLLSVAEQKKITEFIQNHERDIVATVRFLPVTGVLTNGKNSYVFVAMGHDLEQGARMRAPNWTWETLYGLPLHVAQDPQGVVAGQALGFLLGCAPVEKRTDMVQNTGYKPENRPFTCPRYSIQLTTTTTTGQLNAMDFNIVGLVDGGYKDIDEKWLKMSVENAQALLNTDHIRFQSVLMKKESLSRPFIKEFNDMAKKENLTARATYWREHPLADLFNKTQNFLSIFQIFIVTVTLTISGLSVLNTVVKSVKERTKEIGTLRSIGFTGRQVGFIFAMEAFYLSMMGVGVGFVAAVLITFSVNQSRILYRAGLLSEPVLFRIQYDWMAYGVCTLLLGILAVVASHLAAKTTVRSSVAKNLSHV